MPLPMLFSEDEASLEAGASEARLCLDLLLEKLSELEARMPEIGLEQDIEILRLKIEAAEFNCQSWENKVVVWVQQTLKEQDMREMATQFEEDRQARLADKLQSPTASMEVHRLMTAPVDTPDKMTGSVAYDKRYILPKLPRRVALAELYGEDLEAVRNQVIALNDALDENNGLNDQERAQRRVELPDNGGRVADLIIKIVDSDVWSWALTPPQLDRMESIPVLQREARIRGISLHGCGQNHFLMRERIKEVPVILGEEEKIIEEKPPEKPIRDLNARPRG